MRVLFVNSENPVCGVHQYGANLYSVIAKHPDIASIYVAPDSEATFRKVHAGYQPDITLYNWQAGIGGWMSGIPFRGLGKQVFAYHDLQANFPAFNAILFSDPTMKQHDNWFPIGRPLNYTGQDYPPIRQQPLSIGIHGFMGAWASYVLTKCMADISGEFILNMHLPRAVFGDASGYMASAVANECRSMLRPGVRLTVSHEFMTWEQLIRWLAGNDINCYIRDMAHPWRGVSSALDAALCCNRPIAINRSSAFRHMHDCSPSICVEDRSILAIMNSGMEPLQKKREEFAPEKVATQVYDILKRL